VKKGVSISRKSPIAIGRGIRPTPQMDDGMVLIYPFVSHCHPLGLRPRAIETIEQYRLPGTNCLSIDITKHHLSPRGCMVGK
jgi:hypothetical protein